MYSFENPLVSVIIPVHNAEDYLKKCVESIINGKYQNIEIILVENGSTDSSKEICDIFSINDDRVRVFHLGSIGVSSARNYGIENSFGDFVCFIDADDFVSSDYIKYLVNLALKNSVDIAIATNVVSFYDSNDISQKKDSSKIIERVGTSDDALEEILLYKMTVVSCFSRIFKKSFLEEKKVSFNKELYIGEGFNFNVLAFSKTDRIAFSNNPIYFYRVSNPNSAMTKVRIDKIQNGLFALKFLEKTLSGKSERIARSLEYAEWHTNFDFLMLILSSKEIKKNLPLFNNLVSETRKGRKVSKNLPITKKERIKSYCASVAPIFSGKIFNLLRKRKMAE